MSNPRRLFIVSSVVVISPQITALLGCSNGTASQSEPSAVSQSTSLVAETGGAQLAKNASAFVDSIGVGTHANYDNTAYGDYEGKFKPSLLYLGVRHIRDGFADDDFVLKPYRDLHSYGIKVTGVVPYETPSMPALIAMIKTQRDVLQAVEGPNETDLFTQFSYMGQKFPEGTVAFMKDFYSAVKNDMQLKDLPVLQTTLAFPDAQAGKNTRADLLGDLSAYADYGNSHNYFSFGDSPGDIIEQDHLPLNSKITPGKPMMSTEGGYQMGDADGYKGTYNDGQSAPFSEDIHGRYILRYVLEQYRLGYKRSFIYELFDSDQPQWGLFRADGTPRPAAYGIQSMIKLLNEESWDKLAKVWSALSFTPATLNYTLSSLPDSVHTLLLQKSSGAFYLILWNEVKNWNVATGKPVYTTLVPLTLRINQSVNSVRTFLPLTSGTAATQIFNTDSVQLNVPDHPLIVEVTLR
jgi:hypothetical protein